jgi:hypothetical protein
MNDINTLFHPANATVKSKMALVAMRWIFILSASALLILGTIGGILNLIVFNHRSLRSSPYAQYMLVTAAFDLLTIDYPLTLRILSDGFGIDLIATHRSYCKFRFFVGQLSSFIPISMICLAAIDRWAVRTSDWISADLFFNSLLVDRSIYGDGAQCAQLDG